MTIEWNGSGLNEKGYDKFGNCIVEVSADFFRPSEVETLLGDCSLAKNELGWGPEITFLELENEIGGRGFEIIERKNI